MPGLMGTTVNMDGAGATPFNPKPYTPNQHKTRVVRAVVACSKVEVFVSQHDKLKYTQNLECKGIAETYRYFQATPP